MADRRFVSCILPTGTGRRRFLLQALRCWDAQTHRERELVVVDDGSDGGAEALCAGRAGVHLVRLGEPTPLGTKLNAGIAASRGDVIQKWDDDDWYAPRFLDTALGALRARPPGCGLVLWEHYLILLAWTGELYTTGPGHKAGNTLQFDRSLWDAAPFRPVPRAVDSSFLADHPDYGTVDDPTAVVVVRHRANTWTEFRGIEVDPYIEHELQRWPQPLAEVVGEEAAGFYARLRAG